MAILVSKRVNDEQLYIRIYIYICIFILYIYYIYHIYIIYIYNIYIYYMYYTYTPKKVPVKHGHVALSVWMTRW